MNQPKQFLITNSLSRPNSALQPLDSQPNKYNMMMQLPPDNSTPSLQTSKTKKDSQKLFKKLPAVEKLVKKNIKTSLKEIEKTEINTLPPLKNKMMYKSDTFHSNEEFKKQIAKPFNKKSIKIKSSTSTLDPSLTKSLRESSDFNSNTNADDETSTHFLSKSVDYSQEIDKLFERKKQEKMNKISELNDYLIEISRKTSQHIIELPQNYSNFMEIYADDVKFSKDHQPIENFETNMKEMPIDFNLKNQKLQRIKNLDKMIVEKEKFYKELMKKRIIKDDFSETSSNCSDNSKKLFITDLKTKKNTTKKIQQEDENYKEFEFDEIQTKFQMENTLKEKKYDKNFIEININNVLPLRYRSLCDNLTDKQKDRLDELMKEINIGDNIEINNNKSEENPFTIDLQTEEKLKEIDMKLMNFSQKPMENDIVKENNENITINKINDDLYNLSILGLDSNNLEEKDKIEGLIEKLGNKENLVLKSVNLEKYEAYEENIQKLENKAKELLDKINLEDIKSDISNQKILIDESIIHLADYKKKLDLEYSEEMKELEEEYKKKKSNYFKEVLLKLHDEYNHINDLYNETNEFEKKLNLKVQSVLQELNLKDDKLVEENGTKFEEIDHNENMELNVKSLEDYDKQINEAVKKNHPELFENDLK